MPRRLSAPSGTCDPHFPDRADTPPQAAISHCIDVRIARLCNEKYAAFFYDGGAGGAPGGAGPSQSPFGERKLLVWAPIPRPLSPMGQGGLQTNTMNKMQFWEFAYTMGGSSGSPHGRPRACARGTVGGCTRVHPPLPFPPA